MQYGLKICGIVMDFGLEGELEGILDACSESGPAWKVLQELDAAKGPENNCILELNRLTDVISSCHLKN